MTIFHLHNITLTPLQASGHTVPINTQLIAQILVEDKVVHRSEPALWLEGERSWAFKIQSDIPQTCSSFTIKIIDSGPVQSLNFHFEPLLLDLKDVVSNAGGNECSSLVTQIYTSIDCVFQLCAGFTIQGLLVFPLDDREIANTLKPIIQDEKQISAYDLAIVCNSILHLPVTNQTRSYLLNIIGDLYMMQYIEAGSVGNLNRAIDMYKQALQDANCSDEQRIFYMADFGKSLLTRYEQHGEISDLDGSIANLQEALLLIPDDHPSKSSWLNDLGNSLVRRFEQLGEANDLNDSVVKFQEAVELTPDGHPDKPSWLNNLGNSLLTQFNQLGEVNDLNDSVDKFQEAVELTPDGHPDKSSWLNDLGNSLVRRFEQLGEANDLNDSIIKFQEAVELTPDGHPDKPSWLHNLGNSLLTRFEQLGEVEDLNASVVKLQEAVELTPDGHPFKPSWLNNLGHSLLTQFEQIGEVNDLNDSVVKFQKAVEMTPNGHPSKPSRLNNLGSSLLTQFEQLGEVNDLNNSVAMFQEAVELTPDGHPSKPSWLNNLGSSLLTQFKQLGGVKDLNDSVVKFQEAVELTPNGHPSKPSLLNNLGNSLLIRFEQLGEVKDLNDSVIKKWEAVELTPDGDPDKSSYLGNLGYSLFIRFEQLGEVNDINDSVVKLQEAVELTPDGHPFKPSRLSNLGNSLLTQFEQLGEVKDLNDSVVKFQEAVELTPDGHPDKPSWLNNLGNSLLTRFEQLGEFNDLNNSVVKKQEAVELTPDGHPYKPSWLNNLGNSLARRFERLGEVNDLNDSVDKFQEAVELTPNGHPSKPSLLNNLGNSLLIWFGRLGEVKDLNDSIIKKWEAVELTPDGHPDKPPRLNNLGNSLLTQFEQLGEVKDLNDSVVKLQEAVELTPDSHPSKPSLLNNLGRSLLTRFEVLGEVIDLKDSVVKFQEAVELTPDVHPFKPSRLNNLGRSLVKQFLLMGSLDDMRDAVSAFSSAAQAEYGVPTDQLAAASLWAKCLHVLNVSPTVALEPYHIAIPLLSEVSWLGSSLQDRHYQIMKAGNIVHRAATMAFQAGDHKLAVEWLEQGRSVIWGQLLQLRTPLNDIDDKEPILSQRLRHNSIQLENAVSHRQGFAFNDLKQTGTDHLALSKEHIATHAHHLVLERKELLAEIRKKPGFEDFLLAKGISRLTPAASHGPIIILTLSELNSMCCALILLPNLQDDVVALRLESFPPSKAKCMYNQLKQLLHIEEHIGSSYDNLNISGLQGPFTSRSHSAINDLTKIEEALDSLIIKNQNDKANKDFSRDGSLLSLPQRNATSQGFAAILAELWECVAKPILDALAINKLSPENTPRIWWCPTGILSFLPLHAAGLYNCDALLGSKLSDFVISSYTPTLSALLDATTHSPPLSIKPKLLAVAQSSSNNQVHLPGVLEEIKYIEQAVNGALPVTFLSGKDATLEKVTSELKTSNWVHFACHGVQNMAHPTESALLLAGTDQLTLAKLSTLQITHGDLAFLSACQTAKGDEQLSDEAVHLSAGMLVTGYRGVIATMWSVGDHIAPQVSQGVYKHLMSSNFDATEAAHALHLAIQSIREGNESEDDASLMSWVPFIHLGK